MVLRDLQDRLDRLVLCDRELPDSLGHLKAGYQDRQILLGHLAKVVRAEAEAWNASYA